MAKIKPSVIIDILDDEGPYKVIETPKELVDIASDPEGENEETLAPRTPEMEPPESEEAEPPRADSRPTEIISGPKTPPNEPETEHEENDRVAALKSSTGSSSRAVMADPEPTPVVKGPQTPPDEPQGYDPFEPTDSPPMSPSSKTELAPNTPPSGSSGSAGNRTLSSPLSSRQSNSNNAVKSLNNLLLPFLSDTSALNGMKGSNGHIDDTPPVIQPYTRKPLYTSLPANVSAMLHQIPTPQQPKQQRQQQPKNTGSSPVDMDLDSPFSPGSASDLSDLFEPPTGTPPAFTALGSGNNNKASPAGKKPWESSHWAKIIGGSGGGSGSGAGKESKSKRRNKRPHGAGNIHFFLWIGFENKTQEVF